MRSASLYLLLIISIFIYSCGAKRNTLFKQISSSHTGIHFNNLIKETDSINPIDVTNIYNGGGVGIADFNNDGLPDVYFTASLVSNELYLNKGDLKFENITKEAGVTGDGKWCRGVSVVDINNDGWMDIYVSASMDADAEKRRNLFYINQGADKNGIPHFKNMAKEYGLDDTTHTTASAFFDYDNDGDLDVYLTVNQIIKEKNPAIFRPKVTDGSYPSTGRLYRNDWSEVHKSPIFTDVSKQAGVTIEGYGHGATIADINQDGWKDIFVTNDFNTNDLLYINNHDGTFSDKAAVYLKHTSANGMGQDVIDMNNDGLPDIVELDMSPEDNFRKKMMLGSISYQTFQNSEYFHYQYQYVRNSLQLNQGYTLKCNDSIGDPTFSDIGFLSGISETDWSWCPLVADFDNDGFRDIIITNGFPKDITDHDFITFRNQASNIAAKEYTLSQIPQVKIHNYGFKNNGDVTFKNVTGEWGLDINSFSNGAVYTDLDNDGDLDVIVNNIGDEAFVFENTLNNEKENIQHYLDIKLNGSLPNKNGLGTWIEIYYQNKKQVCEETPYRGYLSSVQLNPHFGLGSIAEVDSVVIKWPSGKKQVLTKIKADQVLNVKEQDAHESYTWHIPALATGNYFTDVTRSLGVDFVHQQKDYVDFNIQKLIPHKFSEYGPAIAAGDINGDGLDDIIAGGNSIYGITALLQQPNGKFLQKAIASNVAHNKKTFQDMGITLFDADGDGDPDMYVASGGYENKPNTDAYADRFYINDGKGNFKQDTLSFPKNFTSKSCTRAVDYDNDGDLDLFIAGRVEPWNYPKPVSCFLYRNDSKNRVIKFTDVTTTAAKDLVNIGLVCDALFTDFDNDGWQDMILAGEWMPLTFLKNEKGVFKNITASTGIANEKGWWNSIAPGDFDNDGDIDYIAGNLGTNSFYKATDQYPIGVYAFDFDNNGSYDAFPSLYLPESQQNPAKKEFPAHSRDDAIKQMLGIRSKFQNYKSFAMATIDQLFSKEQLDKALIVKANHLQSCFIKNEGNGKFSIASLPSQAQWSVLNGMVVDDVDDDGNLDVVINSNDYGTDVSVGRYDALNGLVLKGDGKGNFNPLTIIQSGIFIPGNGKAIVKLTGKDGKYLLAASQNRGPLKIFELKKNIHPIPVKDDDVWAELHFKNNTVQRQELYFGASFLSQSSRFIAVGENVSFVKITNSKGVTREVRF